jgi:ribosomal-protein-alanine N-acetyltransferase
LKRWRFLPFCPDDLDAVVTIEAQSFEHPWNLAAVTDELASPDGLAFVLKPTAPPNQPEVGAYILLRQLADEVHIMKLAVNPSRRRQGLATGLANRALAEARREGCHRAILEVRTSNTAAIRLYTRLGFETIGRRKRYYGPTGEDALVMASNLKEAS